MNRNYTGNKCEWCDDDSAAAACSSTIKARVVTQSLFLTQ
jgi:hypothetical protein